MRCLIILLFAGCAATYKPPITAPQAFEKSFAIQKAELFTQTLQAVVEQGYNVTASDKDAGIISTAKTEKRLDETYCDCGTTMGIDYMKDKRTVTKVGFNFTVMDNLVKIKTNISGAYLSTDPIHGKQFECVSKGKLENEMFAKIASEM